MSRQDEVFEAVDSLVTGFRTELARSLQAATANNDRRSSRPSLGACIAESIAPSSTSAPPTPSGSSSGFPGVSRPAFARPASRHTPFSHGATHQSFPLDPALSNPATSSSSASTSAAANPDALPGYSRRPPILPYLTAGLPPKRLHVLNSKSGKLNLEVQARGRDQMVLIQEVPDGEAHLDGMLRVSLKEPESITHVKIRLKGMVRTLVMKAHASGRHPVSDEVVFFEDGRTLWTASDGDLRQQLPLNHSPDPTKLQGTFSFPFSLTIPGRLTAMADRDQTFDRPIRPPPSFMLDAATTSSSARNDNGATAGLRTGGLSTGGFEASCRYYLKVTLGRRGLLKLNERWIIPVVFIPRQPPPPIPSPLRERAIRLGIRPPHSNEDPDSWTERGKYRQRAAVRKGGGGGFWKTAKMGWVEVEGRVPRPQKFPKGAGERIQFEVQITSSDPNGIGRFGPNTVAVTLLQRTIATAQRLSSSHDRVVLTASSVRAVGPSTGIAVQIGQTGEMGSRITYGGSLVLTPSIVASFRAPNLQVAYLLCVTLYEPAKNPAYTTHTHLASVAIPLEIVSCAPLPPVGDGPTDPDMLVPPPAPQQPPPQPHFGARPPEKGTAPAPPAAAPSGFGGAGPPASTSTAPPAPPALPPRTASSVSNPMIDEVEERRLEEEYGLPPSYFDVVGVEGEGRGGR
ncbi:hypothetical protein NBRC10513v2_004316 [Rhodotorula toruloides]|uniref:Proteophosphoglycan ppg4 n=1 Tax=Rhodotorula toruloides TaxID=5286 RepID=A0A0K3CCA7_RHOTO